MAEGRGGCGEGWVFARIAKKEVPVVKDSGGGWEAAGGCALRGRLPQRRPEALLRVSPDVPRHADETGVAIDGSSPTRW